MGWPEDHVDFEDDAAHVPLIGDALSAAELGAVILGDRSNESASTSVPDFNMNLERGGKLKVPCEGSTPPETKQPQLAEQVQVVEARQDKLSSATLTAIDHLTKRMDKLEKSSRNRTIVEVQKGCVLFIVGWIAFFALIFVARIAFHLLDVPFG